MSTRNGIPAGNAAQKEIQAWLTAPGRFGGTGERLRALEEWCRAAGYFDHLREENLYIPLGEGPAALRMQVNYSRLGYRAPEGSAPACPLCFENIASASKPHLRALEVTLAGRPFFAHPTPFPLHPGHCVVNARRHEPMRVDAGSPREMNAFLADAPGWLAASNSDREGTGASILGHHHVQVFPELPLPVECTPEGGIMVEADGLRAALLEWPAPVVRASGPEQDVLRLYEAMLAAWCGPDRENRSANYLLRRHEGLLVLHFFPRDRTYRTPEELLQYKSEGVGIIEVAGELILPPLAKRDREGNRSFFAREGRRIGEGIIRGNGPAREDYPPAFWEALLRRAFRYRP